MFRFWHAVFSPELGLWGIALAIGVGVTMALAPTIRNVRLAHPFFSIAAIWSLGCTFQWLADGGETKMKYIFAFVVGGGIFTLALGAFSWVEGNHAEHLAQATSDTRQEKPTDGKAEEKKKDADKKDSSTVSTQKKDDKRKAPAQVNQESHGDESPNTVQQGQGNTAQSGKNNQIIINQGPQPTASRILTPPQEQELIETLKATPGANVRIIAVGNAPEAHLYSAQIQRAFEAAQWNVYPLDAGFGVTAEGGVASSPINLSIYKYLGGHESEVAMQAFKNAKIVFSIKEGELPYSGPLSLVSRWPQPAIGIQIGLQQ